MAQGKSSVGFWVLISTILVGGGIGAYFLLKKPKEEKEEKEENEDNGSSSSSQTINNSSSQKNNSSSQNVSVNAPSELNDKTKIKAFQNYVLTTKKDTSILGKSGADALWGNNSQKAWDKYGKDYKESLKVKPSSSSSSDISNLEKDINTIINYSTGVKAERTYLTKAKAKFVSDWANSHRNKRNAFIFANQVYRTKTGVKELEWNPLNSIVYAKDSKKIGYENKFANTGAKYYQKGNKIGKVTGYTFQNEVMLFVPDAGYYKWFKASTVTKNKPTSNFEGSNDQIEFSSFDNNFDLNL